MLSDNLVINTLDDLYFHQAAPLLVLFTFPLLVQFIDTRGQAHNNKHANLNMQMILFPSKCNLLTQKLIGLLFQIFLIEKVSEYC